MRITRTCDVRVLAAAGLIGAALLAPGVASAATVSPALAGSCTKSTSDQYAVAKCTSGTGQYRIHAWCVKVDDSAQHFAEDGNWVSVPDKSRAWCPVGTNPVPKSIDKR
ncbi:MAG TPA: hypothetical protein VH637_18400 [Streptosporangiaceae bacterium]|jgi:hypothetical protein